MTMKLLENMKLRVNMEHSVDTKDKIVKILHFNQLYKHEVTIGT